MKAVLLHCLLLYQLILVWAGYAGIAAGGLDVPLLDVAAQGATGKTRGGRRRGQIHLGGHNAARRDNLGLHRASSCLPGSPGMKASGVLVTAIHEERSHAAVGTGS